MIKNITIAGLGFVGASLSTLLSQSHNVIAYDLDKLRVDAINKKKSPVKDTLIEEYLRKKNLSLIATTKEDIAFKSPDVCIICTPTNYDEKTNCFDTISIESVISQILSISNNNPLIVIKSTIPIGYTDSLREKFSYKNIIFSPEFLREGRALEDNLYPSRIVVGDKSKGAQDFANILKNAAIKDEIEIILTDNNEAEAIKLFANSYLALRVSYFNEIDTFSIAKNLNASDIIKGISADPRIGNFYNNPSFGYGGYCLPKDTKQLLFNYMNIPQNMISSIVQANETRINFIVNDVLNKGYKNIGIYKLAMKAGSDNFRSASITEVAIRLSKLGLNVFIFEPGLDNESLHDIKVEKNFEDFNKKSELILANRKDSFIEKYNYKLYTRDIYKLD